MKNKDDLRQIDTIYLDYDDKLFDMVIDNPITESNLNRILTTAEKMHINVNAVGIRRSSSNRLHVMVSLTEPVSFVWSMIYRIRLNDCIGRVSSDLNRYIESGGDISQVNRLFRFKYVNGEKKAAGDWILIYRSKSTKLSDYNSENKIIEA